MLTSDEIIIWLEQLRSLRHTLVSNHRGSASISQINEAEQKLRVVLQIVKSVENEEN